jgi:hypothetical protein
MDNLLALQYKILRTPVIADDQIRAHCQIVAQDRRVIIVITSTLKLDTKGPDLSGSTPYNVDLISVRRLSAIHHHDLYDLMVVDRGMIHGTRNQTDAAAAAAVSSSSSSSTSASSSAEGMSITGCEHAR